MSLVSSLGDRFKAAFTGEVVKVVSGAVLVFALARVLGPEVYGLLFLAISVLRTGKLFSEFGIGKSASRYIAEFKETDPGQVPHVLRTAGVLNAVTIIVISVVLFAGRGTIAELLGEPELDTLLLVGAGFIVFSTVFGFVRWILQSFEAIQAASALTALNHGLRLILVLGFVLIGFGAVGALSGYILAYALTAVIGVGYLIRKVRREFAPTAIQSDLRKKLAKYSVSIAVTQSSHTIDQRVDKILIGFFAGPVAVGYYTLGKQLVQFIETPMTALGFTLSPTYGSQKAQGNMDTAAKIYETALSKALLLYIPAAVGVILLARPGIQYIFGDEYIGAVPVLQILSIFAVLRSATKLTSHGLDYLGRAKERAIIKAGTAGLNVALNIVLIPLFGVTGAAVATVMTYSLYTFASIYFMHVELDLRVWWLLRQFVYAIGIALVMAGAVYSLLEYVQGMLTMVSVICVGVGVWGVLVFAFDLIEVDELREAI